MKQPFVVGGIALFLGVLVGLTLQPLVDYVRQQQRVSFDRCANLSGREAVSCADSLLIEDAVRKQDATRCQSISDSSVLQDCVARVDRLQSLGNLASWCGGISQQGICTDLASIMAASESHDLSKCRTINSSLLLDTCNELVSGATQSLPSAQTSAKPVVSKYQFGYQCDETNAYCVADKKVFEQAVLEGKTALCDQFTVNKDLCLQEVALYRAYTAGKITLCSQSPSERGCQLDYAVAMALDAGNTQPCDELNTESAQACKTIVGSTKEKRFDYLNSAAK